MICIFNHLTTPMGRDFNMATSQDPPLLVKQISRHFSRTSSNSIGDDYSFQDELEFLQNVYYDDLQVSNQGEPLCTLSFQITPSTADDKDKQFVYVEAMVTVDRKYPNSKPLIKLNKSRGLIDSHLNSISVGVTQLAGERLGTPVIYDLIEYIRDCLTNNNRPYGMCVLCQFEFQDIDQFIRTECYHYFHPECLVNYIHYCETTMEDCFDPTIMKTKLTVKKLECPVCRIKLNKGSLNISEVALVDINEEQRSDSVFEPSDSLLAWQKEMAVLYKKQQDNGGIITNTNDDVIDDTWVSTRRQLDKNEQQQLEAPSKEISIEICKSAETIKPKPKSIDDKEPSKRSNHHKNYHGNQHHGNRFYSDNTKRTRRVYGEAGTQRKPEESRTHKSDKGSGVVIITQDGGRKRDSNNGGQYKRHYRQPPKNNPRHTPDNKDGHSRHYSKPTRNQSTAIESQSTASGNQSTAIESQSTASGNQSTATGNQSTATETRATANENQCTLKS